MTSKEIKAMAEKKFPYREELGWDINKKPRKAYEQGIRAGIKLAKQKEDDKARN